MKHAAPKRTQCLMVVNDFALGAHLAARASMMRAADIVMAPTEAAARALMSRHRFDVVMTEPDLDDGDGLILLKDAADAPETDAYLIGEDLSKHAVVAAIRLGARDVFEAPLDADLILDRIAAGTRARRRARQQQRRYSRLRELSSRIVRDRREVRKRVDLVCRDLVGAYRQLAEKVVTLEQYRADDPDAGAY
jgi:DNA-binding NtrC family response regulator